MGFLDNLESSLEAMESGEENRGASRQQEIQDREAERQASLQTAPHADALKASPFIGDFLTACRTIGHGIRVFVQFTWIGNTLRLDAKNKRLELRPTPAGNMAVFMEDGKEIHSEALDLSSDPAALAERWLTPAED